MNTAEGRRSWPSVPLGSLLIDARAGFACGDDDPRGIIQFRMHNVTREGTIDWSKIRRVPTSRKGLHNLHVRQGDLLFNSTSSPELVGKCAVFHGLAEPITFSNHFHRLRPDHAMADSRYLGRWITLQWRRGIFHAMCRQWVNQATVTREQILAIPVPLPPLVEQQRIANVLDQADALRAKRRQALTRLSRLPASCFLEQFGDPAQNPKRWPTQLLSALIADGPQNGLYKPSSDYGDGTPILRIDGFYDGEVTDLNCLKRVRATAAEEKSYGLRENDVVINRVNSIDYLGKSALIPKLAEPTVFESNIMRIRLDARQVDPRFLVEFLQTAFVKRQIRTAAKDAINQASINQQDVKGFQVRVPPLATQRRFANQTVGIERLRVAYRASLAKLDALFASLQHRAFRGEL